MNGFRFFCAAAALILLQTGGCGGGVSGDTWLIAAGGDTASVFEVGAAWNRLNDVDRELFTAKDNPLGHFILTYARRQMLELEIDSRGLMSTPSIVSAGEAWLRFNGGREAVESLRLRERGMITDEEISYFLDHAGRIVWFTLRPGEPGEEIRGPEHLPEVSPAELVRHLDSMTVGQTLPDAGGVPVRLDSMQLTDPATLAQIMADSASSREMAMESIMLTRSAVRMQAILDGMHETYSVQVDTAAVERLAASYRDECGFLDEPLLTSDLESWTSQELSDELFFLSTCMYTQPSSDSWLLYLLDDMLLQIILIDQEGISGNRMDSLQADAGEYMFDIASEWLYDEVISSAVVVTEDDIRYQFDYITEPVMLPERRVLRTAVLPADMENGYRTATRAGEREEFLDRLDGYLILAADAQGNSQLTYAVTIGEIPGGYGELVFGATDADSSGWMGPWPLGDSGDFILFRVEEILPAMEAGLEDLRDQIETAARNRLEEEATVRWMQELEEKYHLEINEEALDRLPADPALWCDL